MIIRVFEGRLRPGSEHDFMAGERELLSRTDIDGLLGVSIGRRLAGGAMHVITLTIWRDVEALERFAAPTRCQPVFLSGSEDLVETWSLTHYDAVDTPEGDGLLADADVPTPTRACPDASAPPTARLSGRPAPSAGSEARSTSRRGRSA